MVKVEGFKISKKIKVLPFIDKGDNSILFTLVRASKDQYISYLSKLDINVQRKVDGFTPLFVAVSQNNSTMVKFLLEKGAKVDVKSKTGHTALDLALKISDINLSIIYNLIKYGGQELIKGNLNYLFYLIRTNNYDEINSFCFHNKSILNDHLGNFTPLTYAILKNDSFIVDILLVHGARIDVITALTNESPLEIAAKKIDIDPSIKAKLIDYQCNPTYKAEYRKQKIEPEEPLSFSPVPQLFIPLVQDEFSHNRANLELDQGDMIPGNPTANSLYSIVTGNKNQPLGDELNDTTSVVEKSSVIYRDRSNAFGNQKDYTDIMGASSMDELIGLIG